MPFGFGELPHAELRGAFVVHTIYASRANDCPGQEVSGYKKRVHYVGCVSIRADGWAGGWVLAHRLD